jgi:hypothetical protein
LRRSNPLAQDILARVHAHCVFAQRTAVQAMTSNQEAVMSENQESKTSFMGTFFDRSVVMRIVRVAEISSWVVLVVYSLQLLLSAGVFVLSYLRGFMQGAGFTDLLQQILFVLEQPFRGIVYFIGLQAIAKILLMFMDIEENTRRAARK